LNFIEECQTTLSGLTPNEQAVLEHLAAAWNAFLILPPSHPDDVVEFRHGLHALQNIVLARSTAILQRGVRTEHAHAPVG